MENNKTNNENENKSVNAGTDAAKGTVKERLASLCDEAMEIASKRETPMIFIAGADKTIYGVIGGEQTHVTHMLCEVLKQSGDIVKIVGTALGVVAVREPRGEAMAAMLAGIHSVMESEPGTRDQVRDVLGFGDSKENEGNKENVKTGKPANEKEDCGKSCGCGIPADRDKMLQWLRDKTKNNEDFATAVITAGLFLCMEQARYADHMKTLLPPVINISDKVKRTVEESLKDAEVLKGRLVPSLLLDLIGKLVKQDDDSSEEENKD